MERALEDLWGRLHELREAVLGLRLTVVEDRPRHDGTLFTDRLTDVAEELAAGLEEAIAAVGGALEHPSDVGAVRGALGLAHSRVVRTAKAFWEALGPADRRLELVRLGRRGAEWRAWAGQVLDAAGRCPEPLAAADDALRRAWSEAVERALAPQVAVHATAIGQQVLPGNGTRPPRAEVTATKSGDEEV